MPKETEQAHTNRRRAESFGPLAQQYDRVRPGYPDALVDDLVALRPNSVLDVGCGTGKATAALAERGLDVLGVEIDARMAEVARSKGVPVEVSAFEVWDAAGRTFDLVVSGQAWHWIDPQLGSAKAASVLQPGGRLALFWNLGEFTAEVGARADAIYDELAPGTARAVLPIGPRGVGGHRQPLEAAGFTEIESRSYRWRQPYTKAEWLDLIATHSDHATMPADQYDAVRERVAALLDELGGTITVDYDTRLLLAAQRP